MRAYHVRRAPRLIGHELGITASGAGVVRGDGEAPYSFHVEEHAMVPSSDSDGLRRVIGEQEMLRCEVIPQRDEIRVRPVGALDLATVNVLEDQFAELRGAGFKRFVLDLSELTFMDSTGLRLILRWDAEARSDGFDLGLVAGPPPVQRVFELTGTLGRLPFVRG
jgi:stage II sporulation protein AA (anti-sigma F factor antagonist)